ncbi:amidohydrolase family protein [Hirschia baltica]|uniref:MGS domain protein n=1 Tax=Hirschia baltica (strain ATCC 49814 / DSM 5838 / IFAM 1418) TaxID=582402 RepID=C6XKE0_HIRBI|nr:amidohydrolase family protein [Hirschia baltica]ACT57738.1 MGS domain protein [Hirschia baltica ATCC 49814]
MANGERYTNIDLIGFNLKMLSKGRERALLISAGSPDDKQFLLESCRNMADIGVNIFATPGTQRLFEAQNIKSSPAHKISSGTQPNIKNLIENGEIDFVINILTGEQDYDEGSDAKQIRSLAIKHGIPLITDREVARETIATVITNIEQGTYDWKRRSAQRPWDLEAKFRELVEERGGWANHHGHFDKAYLISPENLALGYADMEKKWELYRHLKENYTHEDLVERISRALEVVLQQGSKYCRTMIDADSIIGLKGVHAALEVKEAYKDKIKFEIGIQPLEGVLDERTQKQYVEACKLADFCGGLPSRDRPRESEHLDFIMKTAKELGKNVEVHVDQENNPYQTETELLALKTIEHGMQGRVYGIHSISVSCKDNSEQDRIIKLVKEADVGIVICPSAALSMKQLPMPGPLHNSIGPYVKMKEAGVRVYLGIDNIADLFMPIVDGDMWTETRMLMEACRDYDLNAIADWATRPPLHLEEELLVVPETMTEKLDA